jgi:uncharacterized protein (DUF2236 family)
MSGEKISDMGPYGAYNEPLLPPSKEMKNIVGDTLSMAGGVAAVLLQIAVCRILSLSFDDQLLSCYIYKLLFLP